MKKTIYSPAYRALVNRLLQLRVQQGLRQEDVARQLKVSRHWVHKIESCQVRLDVNQFTRLCRIYRADAGRLIRRLGEELSDEDAPFYLFAGMTACCICNGPNSGKGLKCHSLKMVSGRAKCEIHACHVVQPR